MENYYTFSGMDYLKEKVERYRSTKKMKSVWKTLILLVTFFLGQSNIGQSQTTVIIGANSGANTTLTYPCPLQDYYKTQRAQYLYTAAELNAMGVYTGATISSLGWVANATTITGHLIEGYTIYLKNTTTTTLSATAWETGATTVRAAANYSYPSGGAGNITFPITAFVYTGGNLMVEVCGGVSTGGFTSNPAIQWTTALAFNGSHTYRSDAPTGAICGNATVTNTGTQTTRPRLVLTYTGGTPPACAGVPTSLASSAITSTSATISWAAASPAPASGYQYYYSTSSTAPTGATVPSGSTAAGVLSAGLTGLTANTTYYFWVRPNCGASGTGSWSSMASFFTGYCVTGGTNGTYYISNFTTSGGLTNINNTSGYTAGGYTNYTAQSMSTSAGQTVGFTISFGGGGTEGVRIYVDWNNDLDFLDANENPTVASGAYVASGWTSSFVVPAGTPNGNYRMRVVADYLSTTPISCGTSTYLEAEDYTISIVAPCTPSGDQVTYGAGSWIGYVYNSATAGAFTTYNGFVTEPTTFNRLHTSATGTTTAICYGNQDLFTIRYKNTTNFPAGYYTFTVGGDDGVRLSIDGGATWLINQWINQGYTTYSNPTPVFLSGNVNMVFEYFENTGGAQSSFSYISTPACSGTPNAGTAAISTASGCASTAFTLSATGLSADGGITYQWQSSPDGTTWSNIAGATAATYAASATATTYYRLLTTCTLTSATNVTNTITYTVNTCSASITMTDSFGDGWNGATMNVVVNGTTIQTLSLATGTSQTINYCFPANSTYSLVYTAGGTYPGEVGVSMTVNGTVVYSVGAGGAAAGTTLTSGLACPTGCTGTPNSGTAVASNANVCGGSTSALSVTGVSTGGGITYQWQSSSDNATWANISGATASTYTATVSATTYYRLVTTCTNSGLSANSSSVLVSVVSCCNYTFRLTDSFGDGWNGATMQVMQGAGVVATVGSTFTTGTTIDVAVPLANGSAYTLYYAGGGTYPTEVGIQILDPAGTVIYTLGAGAGTVGTTLSSWTANCPAPPAVTSISASPACQGSTVTITGTGFTGITAVQFNGLAATSFTVNSATSITAVIPATATSGNATVTNSLGTGSLALTINTAPAAPTVTAVSTSFCGSGGTTAISASGSTGTYSWSSLEGSPTLSATTGSTINATLTQTSAIQVVGTGGSCPSVPASISIGVYPLPGATMSATPNNFCLGTGTTVNVASGLAAGNFSSVTIPFAPRTAPASATVLCAAGVGNPAPQGSFGVSYDDGGWPNIPIGFTFDFFGTNYTTLNAGTNGNVMFGPFNAASLADFSFVSLPSTTEPFNMVAILALDNNLAGATGGTVKYWTEGYAPNRRFVMSYENVQEFGYTQFSTAQGIFYETTGVIEVHVTSSSAANHNKIVGVNNGNGTIGVMALATVPAIPTSVAYRFTPPANYTTQWYANGVAMGAAGTNVFTQTGLTPTATTTYSIDYTNQTTGCSNDPVNAAVPVTVNTLTLATTPVNGDVIWRGATSTDWNTASNWFAHNGTTYAIATAVPTSTSRTIIPANQTCVLAQPSVNITTAGVAKDVIIETGATLTMTTGTLNVNGNFVNNGTFVAGTGKVAFNAAGTVSGNATTFNDVDLNNGVDFGSSLSTVNGIMTMNTGSWVNTNPPTYGNASLLKYNTGGTYGRGFEWSALTGPGYPNDVQISNNTTINYPNTGGAFSANQKIRRNLTIDAGSNLYMDYGTLNASSQLTVGNDVNIAGDLSLGNQIGGDIYVGGNWTRTTGNLYANNRAVFFNGATGNQTITKTGGESFPYMVVNKASGNVILANNVTTTGGLTLTSGLVEVGTNNLVMGASTLSGGSATSYVKTASTGILSRNVGATAATFPVGNTTYNPAILTNNGTADVFSARVIDNVTADGTGVGATTAEAVVKRTWMIEESVTGGTNATLRLYWNGAGEEINAFSAGTAFMAHYVAAAGLWDNIGGTVGAGYVETSNNTSFSPYTISSSTTFAPLPVELISLGAQCANDNVIVSWSTASEHNTLNYVVERSADGMSWNEVQTVAAAVNSNTVLNYAIEDAGAARGLKYYRLIQTDQDGKQKIYGPVMANCGSDEDIFMSFPNPSDADITLVFNSKNINGSTTLMVRDAHGRVVRSMALEIQPGTDSILVPDMELTPGVYYLQLEGESFKTPVIKHSLR